MKTTELIIIFKLLDFKFKEFNKSQIGLFHMISHQCLVYDKFIF